MLCRSLGTRVILILSHQRQHWACEISLQIATLCSIMHGCALVVVPLISRAFLLAQQPLQEIHVTCKEQNIWIRCTDAYVNCRVCMGLQNKTTEQTKYTVRGRLGRFPEISQVQIFKSVWAAVQHRMLCHPHALIPRLYSGCSQVTKRLYWL